MRAILVMALCVTGCFSDRGLAIEIDIGQTDATSVELYIGKTLCAPQDSRCKTITPPKAACALVEDRTWFRDDAQPYTAPVLGRKATIRLEADTVTKLPIVIAVGFNAAGETATATLFDLEVPVNTGRIAAATLVTAASMAKAQAAPNQDRVQVWANNQTPQGACVVVEHWRPGAAPEHLTVVPANDPDCTDGVKDDTLREAPFCVTDHSAAVGACKLGIRLCNADGKAGATCTPTAKPMCVPDQLCGCPDGACIRTRLASTVPLVTPRIECTIPLGTNNAPCSGEPATVDLHVKFPNGCGHEPQIAALPFGGFASDGMFKGVEIKLGTVSGQQCTLTVTAGGSFTGRFGDSDNGVVELDTKTSALLLPIGFIFRQKACIGPDAAISCSVIPPVIPDDMNALWTCAQ